MEVTKISTKGQVVIPEKIREGFEVGTAFNVIRTEDMIVLKEIKGLSEEEKKEIKELNKIWKEIDSGKSTCVDVEDFVKEFNLW